MSIDIDSYDCAVLREALLVVSPRMITVETAAFTPPIAVASEFHPSFQQTERHNLSGDFAISGGTGRGEGFWAGCSLSAVIELLWPHGLGLYRLAARDAMFLRRDAAEEAGLAEGGAGEAVAEGAADGAEGRGWQAADEFECWRQVCGDAGLHGENLIGLAARGKPGCMARTSPAWRPEACTLTSCPASSTSSGM